MKRERLRGRGRGREGEIKKEKKKRKEIKESWKEKLKNQPSEQDHSVFSFFAFFSFDLARLMCTVLNKVVS